MVPGSRFGGVIRVGVHSDVGRNDRVVSVTDPETYPIPLTLGGCPWCC